MKSPRVVRCSAVGIVFMRSACQKAAKAYIERWRRKRTSVFKSKGKDMKDFRRSSLLLDDTNVSILRVLCERPRIGTSELARAVGMSAPAVRERVQRLE